MSVSSLPGRKKGGEEGEKEEERKEKGEEMEEEGRRENCHCISPHLALSWCLCSDAVNCSLVR